MMLDLFFDNAIFLSFVAHSFFVDMEFFLVLIDFQLPSMLLAMVPYLPDMLRPSANLIFVGLSFKTRIHDVYPLLTLQMTPLNLTMWGFYARSIYILFTDLKELSSQSHLINFTNTSETSDFICAFTFPLSFTLLACHETPFQRMAHFAHAMTSFNYFMNRCRNDSILYSANIVSMHLLSVAFHQERVCFPTISYLFHFGVALVRVVKKENNFFFSFLPFLLDTALMVRFFHEKKQVADIAVTICIIMISKTRPFYYLTNVVVDWLSVCKLWIYLDCSQI